MSKAQKLVQPLLVVLTLGVGIAAFKYMLSTKPEAKREEKVAQGLLVEVQTVHAAQHAVEVQAHGTVTPAQRVLVQPELSGRVVAQNPQLVPGGHLRKGDMLVRLDPRDYKLALNARQAEVSRAQLELQLERGRAQVAEREWKMFGELGKNSQQEQNPEEALALRGPQLRTAQVAVQSASSALDRAKLDLERTTLRAPFNALVIEERAELGQLVTPQTQLATLVGTDAYWVQVSVPVEALAHIDVPGPGVKQGSAARVWQDVGEQRVERKGSVVRLLPDLDQGGAMARLLVEIDDPLGLKQDAKEAPLPMLLNAYVNVAIEARTVRDAIEVPRVALRNESQVFVVDHEDKLRIRDVQIVWRMPHAVLVRDGLLDGEQLVMSRVAAPVDGMSVRKVAPVGAGAGGSEQPVVHAKGEP